MHHPAPSALHTATQTEHNTDVIKINSKLTLPQFAYRRFRISYKMIITNKTNNNASGATRNEITHREPIHKFPDYRKWSARLLNTDTADPHSRKARGNTHTATASSEA